MGSFPLPYTSVIQCSVPTVKLFRIAKATPWVLAAGWGAGKGKKMQKGIARHLSPLAAPQVLTTGVLLKVLSC